VDGAQSAASSRVGAGDRRVRCEAAEVLVFDIVYHLRYLTVAEHPLGEGQAFIAYAEQALAQSAASSWVGPRLAAESATSNRHHLATSLRGRLPPSCDGQR
jgi:hypothetical protein